MRIAVPTVLAALLALTAGCTPSDQPADPTTTTAAPRRPATTTAVTTTAQAATTTGTAPADAQVISVAVAGGKVTPPAAPVDVKLGSTVVIELTADVTDQVHVHGYEVSTDVRPAGPARLQLVADRPGQFEVELESSHLLLLTLRVS